jgi:hypothetical protein
VQRVAYTLTKIAQLGRHGSFYEVSKIVVQDDNTATALFVLLDGHWFISTSVTESGSFELKDSSPEKRGPVTISRRRFEQDVRDGFVILPARSSILQSAKQEL